MKKLFLGTALLSAALLSKAQSVDEIVAKHTEALGGKANIEKIQSVVMEGGLEAMGSKVDVKVVKVPGKLFRQTISIMGMNGYTLVTDTSGWVFMPFLGQTAAEQLTGDMLKEAQQQMDITDFLTNYQAKGNKLELQGKEDVSGTNCFKIKVTDAAGDSSTVYVDPTNWMITRTAQVKKLMGQELNAIIDYSDYKEVEGVKFPFTMNTERGPINFSSIKANQSVDTKLYKKD